MKTQKIKILREDFAAYKSLDAYYHDINQIMNIKMTKRNEYLKSFPVVRYDVKFDQKKKPIPDYFECGPSKIVSEKLKEVLEKFQVTAEFFPVRIYLVRRDEYSSVKYYYLHLMGEIDCFDYENSIYETRPNGSVKTISKLKLKFDESPTRDMFFIKKIGYRIICLTERICEAFVKNDVTGINPVEPETTYW